MLGPATRPGHLGGAFVRQDLGHAIHARLAIREVPVVGNGRWRVERGEPIGRRSWVELLQRELEVAGRGHVRPPAAFQGGRGLERPKRSGVRELRQLPEPVERNRLQLVRFDRGIGSVAQTKADPVRSDEHLHEDKAVLQRFEERRQGGIGQHRHGAELTGATGNANGKPDSPVADLAGLASRTAAAKTPAMTDADVIQIFRKSGALLEGHFVLRSGLHSRQFFQCALALQQMPDVEKLGAALAAKLRHLGATTVIAPAMGGLVIGQEVARQLGLRFIFAEKEEGNLVLRRNFKIAPGEKLLVIEDVVTQGGRAKETMEIVRANYGIVAGVGMVVDRSNGVAPLGVPTFSLLALKVETFDPDNLPPDLAGTPAIKPGSK